MRPTCSATSILVVGGGIAALCAAIAARRAGASVTLAEAAPRTLRGGNTRHSRNLRIRHAEPTPEMPGRYDAEDFLADLKKAAGDDGDPTLSRLLVERSAELPAWLAAQGVIFQTRHIPHSRRTAFYLGGGTAALNALYATAERLGVDILYDHAIAAFPLSAPPAPAVVLCCGGHQADLSHGFVNRGTPFATGTHIHSLLAQGVRAVGRADTGHLVAVDARAREHDGGIVTRLDGMAAGMVVDRDGRRFQEEAAVTGQTRYSAWGQLIAGLPDKRATLVLDADGIAQTPLMIFPPLTAPSLAALADMIAVDAATLEGSAAACRRVRRPPFFAYPIRPGMSFSSLGVAVDDRARVRMASGHARPGLFAAGVIMAANVLGTGYAAGCGMTIGAVFGRIAGEEAARHVRG